MKTYQQGISLIELMVTLVISMILILGVVNIMISSKRAYNVQNDLARLQENARFAIEFLNSDLRMTGYFGCKGETPAGLTLLAGINNQGINRSDIILVTFMETQHNTFSVVHRPPIPLNKSPLEISETTFPITTRGELYVGDTMIVSDCGGSKIHTVKTVTPTTITLERGLSKTYNNNGQSYGAKLRRLVTHRYFIGASDDGFSLFRDAGPIDAVLNTGVAEELIQGVEQMQIRYGEDTDGDNVINQYKSSDNVMNMQNVVAIRITLLLNTIEERFDREPDINTYRLDPELANYNPLDDYRRRNIFTTTVMLRNR